MAAKFVPCSFLIMVVSFLLSPPALSDRAAPAPAPAPNGNGVLSDFIETRCNETKFKQFCIKTLTPYANTIHKDPARLALIATNASLCYVNSTAAYFINLSDKATGKAAAVLRTCRESMQFAFNEISDAGSRPENAAEHLDKAGCHERRCAHAINGTAAMSIGAQVRAEASDKVKQAIKYTDNALHLLS